MAAWLARVLLKLIGWRAVGEVPEDGRFVIVVAPHSSNWDFCIGILIRTALGARIGILVKHTLFFWPLGALLRRLGAIPIDRTHQHDTVQQMVDRYGTGERLALALAPEGTRSRTEQWKSGFYHIALRADVPLCLAFLDYGRKEGGLGPMIRLSGDRKKDMDVIRAFYATKRARHPEKVGPVRIREEACAEAGAELTLEEPPAVRPSPAHETEPSSSFPALGALCLVGLLAASLPRPVAPGAAHVQSAAQEDSAALAVHEPEALLALAVYEIRAGRTGEALELFDALRGAGLVAEQRAVVAREKDRLERWIALRDRFLDGLAAAGKKIALRIDGKKLTTRIEGRDGETLRLSDNSKDLESVALSRVDALAIAEQMGKGGAEFKSTWVRFYAYVIAGDQRFSKLLKEETPEALALREDAESFYPAQFALGEAADRLGALAETTLAADPERAKQALDDILALREGFGELDLVRTRKEPLAALARRCLELRFEVEGLAGLVRGELEQLAENRIRLTYDFEDAEQLRDFVPDPTYLEHERGRNKPVSAEAAPLAIDQGGLVGQGATACRHFLWLHAPITLRYAVEYRPLGGCIVNRFMVAVLDDGAGSYAGSMDLGNLQFVDKERLVNDYAYDSKTTPIRTGRSYELELAHDGAGMLSSKLGGEDKNQLECGPRDAGSVLFWVHSDWRVALMSLEIEAAVTLETEQRARVLWVEEQMHELGLEAGD